MTPTLKASEPNPMPKEKGNLDSHGSVIEDQKSDVKGDVSETVAGSTVNGDDSDNVDRENPSSTETSDADVVTKLSSVLDIFKKGKGPGLILRYLDSISSRYCSVYSYFLNLRPIPEGLQIGPVLDMRLNHLTPLYESAQRAMR